MIGQIMGRDAWKLQSFIDLAYPESKKPNDKRSKEEIIYDLIERLE